MEGISPAPGWGVERWSGAESIFGPGAEKGVCTKNTGAVTSLTTFMLNMVQAEKEVFRALQILQ